jgi:hypothetical protein
LSYATASRPNQAIWSLFYGDARAPVAQIIPDTKHPKALWQIRWPDGRLSTSASLTRTKDAVLALARRGSPARDPRRLHWQQDRPDSPSGARGRVRTPAPMSGCQDARSRPIFSKAECTWRVVAGPSVSGINLLLPLDPNIAARQERDRILVDDHVRKSERSAARKARRSPAVTEATTPHPIAPAPLTSDPFEIPDFLDRTRGTSKSPRSSAVSRPAAEKKAGSRHGASLQHAVA